MSESKLAARLDEITTKGRIEPADVLGLRQVVFADGAVSQAEAEKMFALDAAAGGKCGEWTEFFVEALTDHVVHQETPRGYVSEANAGWLVGAISHDGVVDTETELELLVNVLEKARSSPESLSAFALRQVEHAVVEGRGPVASGRSLEPGRVGAAEVEVLRRVLYAFAGGGNIGVTRAEAEVLFDINDRTAEAANDPAWSDLFVKAVASFVLCASGYTPPSREEALRRAAFLDNTDVDLGGFFSRMVSGGLKAAVDAYARPDSLEEHWAERNRKKAAAAEQARAIDAGEARWLADRIGRDGALHENEKALLSFIKKESTAVHADLRHLVDKVA